MIIDLNDDEVGTIVVAMENKLDCLRDSLEDSDEDEINEEIGMIETIINKLTRP